MKLRGPMPMRSARLSIDTSRSKLCCRYFSVCLILTSERGRDSATTEYPDCRPRGMLSSKDLARGPASWSRPLPSVRFAAMDAHVQVTGFDSCLHSAHGGDARKRQRKTSRPSIQIHNRSHPGVHLNRVPKMTVLTTYVFALLMVCALGGVIVAVMVW
jgi:hypothetical protein